MSVLKLFAFSGLALSIGIAIIVKSIGAGLVVAGFLGLGVSLLSYLDHNPRRN